MALSTKWKDTLRLIANTASDLMADDQPKIWTRFFKLLQPLSWYDLKRETQWLLSDGLDPANFEKPMHYCWLLGQGGTPGLCAVAYDCGRCELFQQRFPRAVWLCSSCLENGPGEYQINNEPCEMINGFYDAGLCAYCDKYSIVLRPITTKET